MTEIVDNSQPVEKILLIRMLSTADVCAIGLPVARYFQQQHSNAEVHFLTFGDGGRLMQLAEPNLTIHTVKKAQWPDDFFQALEAFLAIAETIVGETYTKIVNLDTTFMPCFLARFLKDAHEPVSGNYLNMSISSLLEKVQSQQLQADYVNSEQAYLDSSFTTMYKWQTQWWEFGDTPDGGYPEFYLKRCCGLVTDSLSQSINVVPDKRLTKKAKLKKVVGLCLKQADDQHSYSQTPELKKLLS
ncbi:MAG: hypothetical protein ABJH06_03105, partial [Paraglaciecola sp.]|uniref:hypothetical protein n=1 Tax=Paraglaciecola sp. TaxID=1920173 RepID=UPI0032971993